MKRSSFYHSSSFYEPEPTKIIYRFMGLRKEILVQPQKPSHFQKLLIVLVRTKCEFLTLKRSKDLKVIKGFKVSSYLRQNFKSACLHSINKCLGLVSPN